MKKTLKNRKIQLHRETVRTLDAALMAQVAGGQPITTATIATCCVKTTPTLEQGSTCYNTCQI
jgi:hypothetical protein